MLFSIRTKVRKNTKQVEREPILQHDVVVNNLFCKKWSDYLINHQQEHQNNYLKLNIVLKIQIHKTKYEADLPWTRTNRNVVISEKPLTVLLL